MAMDFGSKTADLGELRASADLVICADVIEHLDDPTILLELLRAAAKPNSPILISTPCRDRLLGPEALRPSNPEHVREWTDEELSVWLRSEGFEILDHQIVVPFRMGLKTTQLIVIRGSAKD